MPEDHPDVHLKKNHEPGCKAVSLVEEGVWANPWFLRGRYKDLGPDEAHTRFDRAGTRMGNRKGSGYHKWRVFACNSRDCGAWGIYDQDAVLAWIDAELDGEKDDG